MIENEEKNGIEKKKRGPVSVRDKVLSIDRVVEKLSITLQSLNDKIEKNSNSAGNEKLYETLLKIERERTIQERDRAERLEKRLLELQDKIAEKESNQGLSIETAIEYMESPIFKKLAGSLDNEDKWISFAEKIIDRLDSKKHNNIVGNAVIDVDNDNEKQSEDKQS